MAALAAQQQAARLRPGLSVAASAAPHHALARAAARRQVLAELVARAALLHQVMPLRVAAAPVIRLQATPAEQRRAVVREPLVATAAVELLAAPGLIMEREIREQMAREERAAAAALAVGLERLAAALVALATTLGTTQKAPAVVPAARG